MVSCKRCSQEIKFIKSAKNQKWLPVNIKLESVVTEEGKIVKGYTPHWATCPNAQEFRKGTDDE